MAFFKMSNSTGLKILQKYINLYLMALNITMCDFIHSQTSHFVVWIFVTYKFLSHSWVHGQVSKCKLSEYKSKV